MGTSFINVNVKIGGQTKTLKMEKGTSFENNGGIYAVRDDGALLFSDDKAKSWKKVPEIKMTAYQNTVFNAIANNDGQAGLSKKDILLASNMAKNKTLAADASEGLPAGYKIDSAKYFGAGVGAQVHVQHNKDKSSGATLNFKVGILSSVKPQAKTQNSAKSNSEKTNTASDSNKYEEFYTYEYGVGLKNSFDSDNFLAAINPSGVEHGFINEEFSHYLNNNLKGKAVTPKLLDTAISKALDYNAYDENVIAEVVARYQSNLSSETIDKFLKKSNYIHVSEGKYNNSPNVSSMKNLYSRLNDKQKEMYNQKLLTKESVTGFWATTGDEMHSNCVDYIFEKPLKANTYNKLKQLIYNVNKSGNGIDNSRTASKETINTLLQRGQITQTQARELSRLAGLLK